jgi:hypothetical protein
LITSAHQLLPGFLGKKKKMLLGEADLHLQNEMQEILRSHNYLNATADNARLTKLLHIN